MGSVKLSDALKTVRGLLVAMPHMSLDELKQALELEYSTRRRETVINRLKWRINNINRTNLNKEY